MLSTETIRPDCNEQMFYQGNTFESRCWREELSVPSGATIVASYHDDTPAVVRQGKTTYVASLTCDTFLISLFESLANECAIPNIRLPKDMRIVHRGDIAYVFNYASYPQEFPDQNMGTFILGQAQLNAFDVAVIKINKT